MERLLPTSGCTPDAILFHHRAEIGCGRRIRTINCAFKERRVAHYSIPQRIGGGVETLSADEKASPAFDLAWQPSSSLRSAKVYKRFFAKARPEGLFRYRSKASALSRSLNAIAVLISHGRYFEVCGTSPLLCFNNRLLRSSVQPVECRCRSPPA